MIDNDPQPLSLSPSSVVSSDNEYFKPKVLGPVLSDLERLREELGPDDVKVAETWASLGLIRMHMQRITPAAIKCHEEALRIYRKNGSPPMQVSITLNDLAACYERVGDMERALSTYQEALDTIQTASEVSPTHRIVQSITRSLARLQRR